MIVLQKTVDYIVKETKEILEKHLGKIKPPIDWVAIFSWNEYEYNKFLKEISDFGTVIKDTANGPIFKLNKPIDTDMGQLSIIKIRKPDKTRFQRGDADYRIDDGYSEFKQKYISEKHFTLIKREDFEMIEIKDSDFDALVYFSNPPISKVLGLR